MRRCAPEMWKTRRLKGIELWPPWAIPFSPPPPSHPHPTLPKSGLASTSLPSHYSVVVIIPTVDIQTDTCCKNLFMPNSVTLPPLHILHQPGLPHCRVGGFPDGRLSSKGVQAHSGDRPLSHTHAHTLTHTHTFTSRYRVAPPGMIRSCRRFECGGIIIDFNDLPATTTAPHRIHVPTPSPPLPVTSAECGVQRLSFS